MCFSVTASFAASAVTAAAGILAASRVRQAQETPLAAIPFVFSLQQAAEGGLWLTLHHRAPAGLNPYLANLFVVCALIVWPVLVPSAARLVETNSRRFLPMDVLVAAGFAAATYAVVDTIHHPYFVQVTGRSLCYINNSPYPLPLAGTYMLAICGSLLISSHRALRTLGSVVASGLAISLAFYFTVFLSVWCFFAAAASTIVCAHFFGKARTSLPATA